VGYIIFLYSRKSIFLTYPCLYPPVPPTQLTILDHHGAEIRDQTAGPYLEGDSIDLTCLSSGGVPPPRVSWWREHALMDDSFQVLPDGSVRNVLRIKNIQRKDLLTVSHPAPRMGDWSVCSKYRKPYLRLQHNAPSGTML